MNIGIEQHDESFGFSLFLEKQTETLADRDANKNERKTSVERTYRQVFINEFKV